MNIKKIAVLTSGGDSPGMNTALRAVVRTCAYNKIECIGVSRGFQGFSLLQEGGPVALQRFACMQDELYKEGRAEAKEVADMIALAADGYLREQDMTNLRVQDVVFSDNTVALLLGRSSRGESCKTGRDQGVVMDELHSLTFSRGRCRGSPPEGVFSLRLDIDTGNGGIGLLNR